MALSVGLGVGFEVVVRKVLPRAGLPAGVAYGVAVWAVMTWGALPRINPIMFTAETATPLTWFAAHAVFGATLALTARLGLRRSSKA